VTVAQWVLCLAAAACVGTAAGLAWGRRAGRREGFGDGGVQAALDLRVEALEQGRCPICGRGPAAPPGPPFANTYGMGESRAIVDLIPHAGLRAEIFELTARRRVI